MTLYLPRPLLCNNEIQPLTMLNVQQFRAWVTCNVYWKDTVYVQIIYQQNFEMNDFRKRKEKYAQ